MAQSKSTHSQRPKLTQSSVVTKQMGDRYALGFASALRFLQHQILCRLYKSHPDETVNQGPPCVYAKRSHVCTRAKDPVVTVRVQWTVAATK